MIIRQALFEGVVHADREQDFRAYVTDKLMPMWKNFPGACEVRVMFEVEHDDGFADIPLSLAMAFPDRAALEQTLTSDIRLESRAVTQGLFDMFDGKIRHHIFEITDIL